MMAPVDQPTTGPEARSRIRPELLFWGFVALHAGVWTLLPSLLHPNVPMDVAEGLAWGREWQWGYPKHPPLQAWLLELWTLAFGRNVVALYVLGQAAVVVSFWAVWRLAGHLMTARRALLAVLLLEGIYYFNYESVDFNPNVLQLPLWALSALALYRAARFDRLADWCLFGVFAAASVLAKYSAAFLLPPATAFLLLRPEGRARLGRPGPYVAGLILLAALAPHLVWLMESGFAPLRYATARAAVPGSLLDHALQPARFVAGQALALLPFAILAVVLVSRRDPASPASAATAFDRAFVAVVGLGPFVLYVAAAAAFGFALRMMWAAPLWSLVGIAVLVFLPTTESAPRLRWFARTWIAIFALAAIAYAAALSVGPYARQKPSRGHFAGPSLAALVGARWQAATGAPLAYVVGEMWLAGNVAFYSPDRPAVYEEADPAKSPWIDESELKRRGAIFLWEARRFGTEPPPDVARRFPGVRSQGEIALPWRRPFPLSVLPVRGRLAPLPPSRIGWGILLPEKG